MVYQNKFLQGFLDFKMGFMLWLEFVSNPNCYSWFGFWASLNTWAYYRNGGSIDYRKSPYPLTIKNYE